MIRLFKRLIRAFQIRLARIVAKPSIVFESVPDFADNTFAVYDEMRKRDFEKNYYLIWKTQKRTKKDQVLYAIAQKNGSYYYWDPLDANNFRQDRLSYGFSEKRVLDICCNDFLTKSENNEPVVFLNHGGTLKSVRGYYEAPHYIDCLCALSDYLIPSTAYTYNYPVEKVVSFGFPRNDILLKSKKDIKPVFNLENEKIIAWLPTYRPNKTAGKKDSDTLLPVLSSEKELQELNEHAKNENVFIVVKIHHAQNTQMIKQMKLSNIVFIDNDFLNNNNLIVYELLAKSDALLTDYSSVYYDYLLCDKPVGAVWEDIEAYKANPGFAVDVDYVMKAAVKIYNLDELLRFISDVSAGNDILKAERKEIREKVVQYVDDQSSKRAVDYIVEKYNL